jgi:hypothetical protein
VAAIEQVHVQIPQTGQDRHPFGRNPLIPARHRERLDCPNSLDAIAADEDDAVADRLSTGSVYQCAPYQRRGPDLSGPTRPLLSSSPYYAAGCRKG